MEMEIKRLFEIYERFFGRSLRSRHRHGGSRHPLYASAFVAGVAKSRRHDRQDDDRLKQVMAQGYAHYRSIGTNGRFGCGMSHLADRRSSLRGHVAWTTIYGRNEQPDVAIDFDVHYLRPNWLAIRRYSAGCPAMSKPAKSHTRYWLRSIFAPQPNGTETRISTVARTTRKPRPTDKVNALVAASLPRAITAGEPLPPAPGRRRPPCRKPKDPRAAGTSRDGSATRDPARSGSWPRPRKAADGHGSCSDAGRPVARRNTSAAKYRTNPKAAEIPAIWDRVGAANPAPVGPAARLRIGQDHVSTGGAASERQDGAGAARDARHCRERQTALWGNGNQPNESHAACPRRRRCASGDRSDAPSGRRRDLERAAPRVRPEPGRDRPGHGRDAAGVHPGAGADGPRVRSLRHQADDLDHHAGGAARHGDPRVRGRRRGAGAGPLPDRRRAGRRGHGAAAPDHALGAARALRQHRLDGPGDGQHGGRPAGDGAFGLSAAGGRLDPDVRRDLGHDVRGHRALPSGGARRAGRQRRAQRAARSP